MSAKELFREAALSGREGWIEKSLARGSGDRHHAYEREALVAGNVRIIYDYAEPDTTLFVS